ncbi:hypothetical protein ACTJLC_15665 [Paraburkholderia sp. 22099]|jgi:hypothetical protein|uniref:Uncharacterized protein n=1 Tax=Paraburkholderia terricola TaxID=169427 RepID=A0A1M6NDY8_9BURK|nr:MULTISPECIES: hypothetical protein [Paraburkholderia]ORC52373.1 hypothetical protein B2G74_07225 [Burkholderia sp. A27]AXE95103.1 hypothetical protein CUJ90_22425 [Paraburkholderia terricola]MDR6410267.1 hypothetical protein [Paraburkholderia terricola]MDR6444140.1 hypothetical protein [Paraburkholderia terricola]MDR6481427.1 hypothetical protein [Paraburkholderia terricola]
MTGHPADHDDAVAQVNSACLRLFDTWCESRSVIPLGYLLHCWPLPDNQPASLRRLADGLRELSRAHPGALDGRIWPIFCELALCIDEILPNPSLRMPNMLH